MYRSLSMTTMSNKRLAMRGKIKPTSTCRAGSCYLAGNAVTRANTPGKTCTAASFATQAIARPGRCMVHSIEHLVLAPNVTNHQAIQAAVRTASRRNVPKKERHHDRTLPARLPAAAHALPLRCPSSVTHASRRCNRPHPRLDAGTTRYQTALSDGSSRRPRLTFAPPPSILVSEPPPGRSRVLSNAKRQEQVACHCY